LYKGKKRPVSRFSLEGAPNRNNAKGVNFINFREGKEEGKEKNTFAQIVEGRKRGLHYPIGGVEDAQKESTKSSPSTLEGGEGKEKKKKFFSYSRKLQRVIMHEREKKNSEKMRAKISQSIQPSQKKKNRRGLFKNCRRRLTR